jgi:hypothetical protein
MLATVLGVSEDQYYEKVVSGKERLALDELATGATLLGVEVQETLNREPTVDTEAVGSDEQDRQEMLDTAAFMESLRAADWPEVDE